jgi:uncharacterized membrane protein YdjX (TVP38/TMEM64 family)
MGETLARFGERVGRKVRSIIPIVVGSTVLVLLLSLVLTGIYDYLPADAKAILGRLQAGDLVEARGLLHSSIGQSGAWQYGAFLALQVLQVVFAPIPSQATGLLGGYLFGFWVGLGLTMLGLTIGSTLAVIAGRLLGAPLVGRLVPASMRASFNRLVGESEIWSFLFIFMLPIFPGDSVCFIAGLTRLPLWQLVLASAVGRLPGMAVLTLVGAQPALPGAAMVALLTVVVLITAGLWLYSDELERRFLAWQRHNS